MRQPREPDSTSHDGKPLYRIRGDLYDDDPHWRSKTLVSAVGAVVVGLAARATDGTVRIVLCVVAGILALPALSTALLVAMTWSAEKYTDHL